MEHAEARELLEIAAVEPGGFDRLAAGDTAEAAALAGHVAGCIECAAELERLRRASVVIRDAVRTSPPADLRDRTLAFVAAVGRPRGAAISTAPALSGTEETAAASGPSDLNLDRAGAVRRPGTGGRAWIAAIAAAVAIAVLGTSLLVSSSRDSVIQAQATQIASLAKVATWSLRIDGQADATYIDLTAPDGSAGVDGTLAFSPGTKELVVLAEGLKQPPAGMQYRCWVEINGSRRRIGQMFFGGDVAYWVGAADTIAEAGPGTTFGVSLVPADGDSLSTDPVLQGGI
jgi:hypothetical protein